MSDLILDVLMIVLILGSGLMAGTFFIFSVSVMGALRRLPSEQGIAAMQWINIVIINPIFLLPFFLTALASFVAIIASFLTWGQPSSGLLLAGGLVYALGSFGVTVVCNVPRNNALAAVDPSSNEGQSLWDDYLKTWTLWNHVRSLASFLAMLLFVLVV